MSTPVVKSMPTLSAWFFLVFGVALALFLVIGAVNQRNFGLGISGIGFALTGVGVFLAPIDIRRPFFEQLRNPPHATNHIAVIQVIGLVLLFIGVALRWIM
jgi:hypothetical protein